MTRRTGWKTDLGFRSNFRRRRQWQRGNEIGVSVQAPLLLTRPLSEKVEEVACQIWAGLPVLY